MREFIDQGLVGGEIYEGDWVNVGTVAQLEELNAPLARRPAHERLRRAPRAPVRRRCSRARWRSCRPRRKRRATATATIPTGTTAISIT
jgi:NDP-sugar pyrophosphorylase family protein